MTINADSGQAASATVESETQAFDAAQQAARAAAVEMLSGAKEKAEGGAEDAEPEDPAEDLDEDTDEEGEGEEDGEDEEGESEEEDEDEDEETKDRPKSQKQTHKLKRQRDEARASFDAAKADLDKATDVAWEIHHENLELRDTAEVFKQENEELLGEIARLENLVVEYGGPKPSDSEKELRKTKRELRRLELENKRKSTISKSNAEAETKREQEQRFQRLSGFIDKAAKKSGIEREKLVRAVLLEKATTEEAIQGVVEQLRELGFAGKAEKQKAKNKKTPRVRSHTRGAKRSQTPASSGDLHADIRKEAAARIHARRAADGRGA